MSAAAIVITGQQQAAETVRKLRRRRGLSQKILGDLAGVAQSWVCAFESGERRVGVATFIALADALGYDLALVPRDADARSARPPEPQTAQQASGVPEYGSDGLGAAETISGGGCDCGHEGLDEMYHLQPCLIAVRRAARRRRPAGDDA